MSTVPGMAEPMQVDFIAEENENFEAAASTGSVRQMVESSTMDLEAYVSNYKGMARLIRLTHIADHCPALRVEALRMVLGYVQQTHNTNLYQQIHRKLQDSMNTHVRMSSTASGTAQSMPALDSQWIESTSKKAALKLERLDMDLKNYKSNSIKESIRRGHDDLGDHYLDCGDLSNALKCYSRARDYCTSAKHLVNMCLNVIKVSVYLQNWSHVLSYVTKAESTPFISESGKDGSIQVATKLKVAAGLADLVCMKYKTAAKYFLAANFDHVDFPELLSANNIATYGTLCALATFDRSELLRLVINSATFKLFLELDPQLRDILNQFYHSKYASCLKSLDELRDTLYLDVYLYAHVNSLYGLIRKRALCQYFSPYLSGDMHLMATAFNTSVQGLEEEVMQLILEGKINARIDSHRKILVAKETDQRSLTFEKSMEMGVEFQKRARALILRAAVIRSQIQVKSPPREGNLGGEMALAPGNTASVRN